MNSMAQTTTARLTPKELKRAIRLEQQRNDDGWAKRGDVLHTAAGFGECAVDDARAVYDDQRKRGEIYHYPVGDQLVVRITDEVMG